MTKVVILCGGKGTRLREETEHKPKPMVGIGGKPILWYIMKTFSYYKLYDFVLCLGYKGEAIKEYFNNYDIMNGDFKVNIATMERNVFIKNTDELNWNITLANTGQNTMTGARIKKIEKYIDGDYFIATYGDAVADININELISFHKKMGKIATLTGIRPSSKYGELETSGNLVTKFNEKPRVSNYVNGGFFVFEKKIFDYLNSDENCVLETIPLEMLSKDNELAIFKHDGYWQCMDTYRDYEDLNEKFDRNDTPWIKWQEKPQFQA
jgi:glucose-1-phosphate cytidylyltransferase